MYRVDRSLIAGHPRIQRAFSARGIRDYASALEVGRDFSRRTQVFVMQDGRVMPSDAQVVLEIARAVEAGRL